MEPWVIFIPFLCLVIALIIWGAYAASQRRKALEAWAAQRGLTYDPSHDDTFVTRYPAFACFKQGDQDRYAFNIMRGNWGPRPLVAFDYHYETVSHDSKGRRSTTSHYFSGVILDVELPLKPLSIRPEGFFDKIGEFFGYDDIDFESAEFSRRFHVSAPERRWAFDVLHQRAMEFLLAQPQFTIQFDRAHALAWRGGKLDPPEFEQAAGVLSGLLDQLPGYVKQQLDAERSA